MRIAMALLLAASLAACASTRSKDADPAFRGRRVAEAACSACHAVKPGDASAAPRAPAFATLEMRHTAGIEGRVAGLARSGHYGMPPVQLDPGQAADLVAYIESLAKPAPEKRKGP